MESFEKIIIALLISSVICLILPVAIFIVRMVIRHVKKGGDGIPTGFNRKLIIFSAFLIASIWSLRFAVGYYQIITSNNVLTPFEEIFNSLIHTLQTFSMDEDYTAYITDGKAMMAGIFGEESVLISVYGIYATILNFVAPVAGGAIIFEILASVFPTIILRMSYLAFWRDKYYFSELNERTIALIRSINKAYGKKIIKPVIIVTDSYVDDESERSSELANKAKLLGAICIKNDIVHIPKNRYGKKFIFLIDEQESNNIYSLVELSNTLKGRQVTKTEIYHFSTNELHTYVEKQVRDNFKLSSNGEQPVILSVNGYRNLVTNLLIDVPLFEPIVHEYNKKPEENNETELNVTILGMGQIGTEMFLATYWCGQILNCKLHITVISKETEEEFWQNIDYINPEIRKSTKEHSELLKIYSNPDYIPNGAPEYSAPYCEIDYKTADIKSNEFLGRLETEKCIRDTDYFFVALGSDEENTIIANKLREVIGQDHILHRNNAKTVIAYVVFNSDMCAILNAQKLYSYSSGGNDIYMKAVGALDEMYSVNNIFMADMYPLADKAHMMYYSSLARETRKKYSQKMAKDEYSYWANMARAAHSKYKVFSSGVWKTSLFDKTSDYAKLQQQFIREYKNRLIECSKNNDSELLHELAWLEHRRWNAFMRTRGFKNPDNAKEFLRICKSQKNLELKLHLCLVECDKYGMKANMSSAGEWNDFKLLNNTISEAELSALYPDLLDELTYDIAQINSEAYDFKLYDYPLEDFNV